MSEIISKIKKSYREGRLIPVLKSRINPYLKSLKYVVYDPVPKDEFKLLFRYPAVDYMLNRGKLHNHMDIFCYLYERRVAEVEEPLQ